MDVMPLSQALQIANEKDLDLIEISPKANPPVVKISSFDKFRYQQEKALAAQRKKQKKVELKGIRISVRIGQHDMDFKAKQADKFLKKGNKVKVEMFLKGRERANIDFAFEVMEKFISLIQEEFEYDQKPKKQGHIISAVLSAPSEN